MKVLIVDDKKENLYLLERMLKKIGHEVVMAENGKQALEKFHSDNFKMIISDILMPVMDGYQLCQAVRSNKEFNDILFIFYTATYVEKEDEELALKLGANKFIRKPMEPEKFIKIIKNLLQNMEISQVKPKKDIIKEEKELFKLYSERLVNKLEQKMLALEKEIIKRKKVEEKLRSSKAFIETIINKVPDVIFSTDIKRFRNYVSQNCVDLFGYTVEEFNNTPQLWNKIILSEDKAIYEEAYKNLFKGESFSVEYRITRKDGGIRWIRVFGTPTLDSEGNLERIDGIAADITEHMKMDQKLRESEEKYREILENIKDLYFEVDLKGNFIFFNDMIGEILGYSKSELSGMNYRNIMNKESAKIIFNVFNTVFKTNNIYRSAEFEIKNKYGKRIVLDSNIYLKYDSTGKKIGFRGLARDITERKKSEILRERFAEKLENKVKKRTKELNESLEQQKLYQEQLLKASQFKSKFLASMSHELRTPLNSVIGFTDILLEGFYGEINEKQDHYLNNIRSSAFHLLDLINEVLDISKIEAGKIELNIEEFSLNKIANQIISTLKPMYEEKKLKFEVIGLDEEKFIQADPIRFKEILYNLLNNAIKFTKKGGFRLEIAEREDHLEFNIIDTGIGIAEEDFDLIFKEFKRVKSDYVYSVEGTGLGLSLSKRFIELHGGNISFTSKLGEGTTFTFILPKKMIK